MPMKMLCLQLQLLPPYNALQLDATNQNISELQLNMEKGEEEYKQAWLGMRDKDGGGVNFQVKHVFFVEQILRTPLWVFFISKSPHPSSLLLLCHIL